MILENVGKATLLLWEEGGGHTIFFGLGRGEGLPGRDEQEAARRQSQAGNPSVHVSAENR